MPSDWMCPNIVKYVVRASFKHEKLLLNCVEIGRNLWTVKIEIEDGQIWFKKSLIKQEMHAKFHFSCNLIDTANNTLQF